MKTQKHSLDQQNVLGSVGLRCTAASRAVLNLFDRDNSMLMAHAEVNAFLKQRGIDVSKVTLYRLLDRFVATGLLQRTIDQDRVARYVRSNSDDQSHMSHMRFQCQHCHRLFNLTDSSRFLSAAIDRVFAQYAAQGYQGQIAEIAIRGICQQCATPH